MSRSDRVEFASYQLKDVDHIWFTQWKGKMSGDVSLVTWNCFTRAFVDRFFLREFR